MGANAPYIRVCTPTEETPYSKSCPLAGGHDDDDAAVVVVPSSSRISSFFPFYSSRLLLLCSVRTDSWLTLGEVGSPVPSKAKASSFELRYSCVNPKTSLSSSGTGPGSYSRSTVLYPNSVEVPGFSLKRRTKPSARGSGLSRPATSLDGHQTQAIVDLELERGQGIRPHHHLVQSTPCFYEPVDAVP